MAAPNRREPEERDLVDAAMDAPLVGPGISRLQRVFGPSCLLSLVLLLFFIVITRQWLRLPWPAMIFCSAVIWMLVLTVLVRLNNAEPDT